MKIFKAPFFIAEMSANHNGSFEHAKKLIKTAKVNGADAIKLQTFTPDTMTLKSDKKYFKVNKGLWKNKKLWDLYNEAKTPLEWHKPLFDYAKKLKLTIFSTPFDETAVDFLEKLQCPIYKVASFEMTDISLIKKIALTVLKINKIKDAIFLISFFLSKPSALIKKGFVFETSSNFIPL